MLRKATIHCLATLLLALTSSGVLAIEPPVGVEVSDLAVTGRIEGTAFTFDVGLNVTTKDAADALPLVKGDVVLDKLTSPAANRTMSLNTESQTYAIRFAQAGAQKIAATFAARANIVQSDWRESTFELPAARIRKVTLICDRVDLEVQLPGALRVQREIAGGKLTITALLAPSQPFTVRWKPQVQKLEGKLVVASEANTIATVSVGAMRLDNLFDFKISQGTLNTLSFSVPRSLSVTQVKGEHIQDWTINKPEGDAPATLTVQLNRTQTQNYRLQIISEMALQPFPTQVDVPVIIPQGGLRAGGNITVGTNSAIQLVVKQTVGLTQINGSAFPRVDPTRALPSSKAFYYTHATTPFKLAIAFDHIVPSYDVRQQININAGENNLVIVGQVEFDVRDAPVRHFEMAIPTGYNGFDIAGEQVEDHTLRPPVAGQAFQTVDIYLKKPTLGPIVFKFKLDLGKSPLGVLNTIEGFNIKGGTLKQSFIVMSADEGVYVDEPQPTNLRPMNTAAVTMRVPNAQFAYSFRQNDWSVQFTPRKQPASIRAETFHLITLGDGLLYGNVAVSYFVTGSPIDTFRFRVPADMTVQFVGQGSQSIQRDADDPELVTIKLDRKVKGHYNLSLVYTKKYQDGDQLEFGNISPTGDEIQTQSGFIVVASHLHLDLTDKQTPKSMLVPIPTDEVPNVNLLVTAPVLKAYKYAQGPHNQIIQVRAFDRVGLLPAVIEVTDIETELFIDEKNQTQSRTVVRYKVKNWSRQHMPIRMPEGVQTWQVRSGLTVVHNGQLVDQLRQTKTGYSDGMLLVPLPRQRNANTPLTVEVEYGRQYDSHDNVQIVAPSTDPDENVQATLTNWTIKAPKDWAVNVSGTSTGLLPNARPKTHGTLATPIQQSVDTWTGAFGYLGSSLQFYDDFLETHVGVAFGLVFFSLFVALIAVLCIGNLQTVAHTMSGMLLLMLLVWFWNQYESANSTGMYLMAWTFGVLAAVLISISIGLLIGRKGVFAVVSVGIVAILFTVSLLGYLGHVSEPVAQPADDWTEVHLTQTVSIDSSATMAVEASITPTWNQYANLWGTLAILVAVLCTLGVLITFTRSDAHTLRRYWKHLTVIGLFSLLIFLSQYPPMERLVVALLTWVPPMLLLVYVLVRVAVLPLMRFVPNRAMATTAAIILVSFMSNAATAQDGVLNIAPKEPVLESVEAKLKADGDSVEVDLTLKISATEPVRYLLMDQTPILLTPDDDKAPVRVRRQGGKYYLHINQAGTHTVALKFLSPLPKATADQSRYFQFPLPSALTNRVDMAIPATGLDITVDKAMKLSKSEANNATSLTAMLGPGDDIGVRWKPRARETSKEDTRFFAQVASAVRFDASLVEGRHLLKFQIAQGEMKEIRVNIPKPMTVTAVQGKSLGAWRFDPTTGDLDVRLAAAFTGEYQLHIVTQISQENLPYESKIGTLVVQDAVRQRGVLGLMSTSVVFLTIDNGPQTMNTDDFARDAAAALKTMPNYVPGSVRHAYRTVNPGDSVTVQVNPVTPEVRAYEDFKFFIGDERLIYNGTLQIQITKAGVFSAELKIPATYEVDTLVAPQINHWDEAVADGVRTVTVHFKQKHIGDVPIRLVLSQATKHEANQIDVPRVKVTGAMKHTGFVAIAADIGFRVTADSRDGVTEINPLERGIREPGALAFELNNPDWKIQLKTEVIEPRTTVDFLHIANVTDATVRHTHYLRYRLTNAGTKVFEITVPKGAMGLLIEGRDIARRQEIEAGSGRYRIELDSKWYDDRGVYPLTVTYEIRLNMPAAESKSKAAETNMHLLPVVAVGADLQRGHIAVFASERFQLTRDGDANLQISDARRIPRVFNAGDLSAAVFCFTNSTPKYDVLINVKRHGAADLLQADATQTHIVSVVSDNGNSVNRVQMQLRVWNKQYLKVRLPDGAKIWSAIVNDNAVLPSSEPAATGDPTILIPLGAAAKQGSQVFVEFVYAHPQSTDWTAARPNFTGPQFDLPLKDVKWVFVLPPQYEYADFEGSLVVDKESLKKMEVLQYRPEDYDGRVYNTNQKNEQFAKEQQQRGEYFAQQGDRSRGKQALESALHYSAGSEDARVKLHKFNTDNAWVAWDNNRKRLRAQVEGNRSADAAIAVNFDEKYAERVRGSMTKEDRENVQEQIKVWTQMQQEAAGDRVQLNVEMPYRGRLIDLSRSVQVQENAEMTVSFRAERKETPNAANFWWPVALFVLLALGFWCYPMVNAMCGSVAATVTAEPERAAADDGEIASASNDVDADDAASAKRKRRPKAE